MDRVVERNGITYAHESKNARRPVPAGTHALKEALKDADLIQTEAQAGRTYVPVWHFWDAGPVHQLANVLKAFGIRYIVYNPK